MGASMSAVIKSVITFFTRKFTSYFMRLGKIFAFFLYRGGYMGGLNVIKIDLSH
jgi:hypothetical protein